MQFDPRTQAALREGGLTTEAIETASDHVTRAVGADADRIECTATVSDTELAHGDDAETHTDPSAELSTHAADLRGWLSLDGLDVSDEGQRVSSDEGRRVSSDEVVELSLGPTVHDRVRFTLDREAL